MDSIINSALEEICAVGATGLTLPSLWPKLQSSFIPNGLPPCMNVKKALWTNLLNIPGLQFESRGVCYDPHDSVIQSVEDSEKLNLKIVAAEHLRNCFVGLYDIQASNTGISVQGRRALERIAIARTNGIAQSELGKEFGLPGNKIFYVLRKLECQGLIVRQSTILRKTEVSSDRVQTNSSIVSTNMVHLYRFAKHLGCQQRLEVIKEDKAVNEDEETALHASGMVEESVIEQVKDFLPELKHICDKLEKADNNVLIVSDLKKDLGYCGTPGHRRWRNILHRLKDARVVEEFIAKVNTKEVSCLKLLKKFSPKHFEPKSGKFGLDDLDVEELVILGKRGQINDQLVELPLEHQVYDIIDAEGSKGLSKTELCKRLGLNNKRYNTRLQNLFSRFGMHLQAESLNRGVAYRVWSHRNFNREASSTYTDEPDIVLNDNETSVPDPGKRSDECSIENVQLEDDLSNKEDAIFTGEIESVSTELEIFKGLPAVGDSNMLLGPSSSENLFPEPSRITPVAERHLVNKAPITEATTESHISSTPHKRRSRPKYLCLTMNALSRQREHRILELLQEEKFMIKAELHRHIESLDKDKQTTMDRKTLERSLNKLQQEGLCKLIHVGVPSVTNCGRSRTMDIVLHSSLDNISPELLSQIYERVRSFEMQIRNHQSSAKLKKSQEAPILDGVQRILANAKDDQSERIEAMRENGYVPAKMVRAKLLHVFFWRYLTKLPGWNDALSSGMHGYDQKNPHSTCKMIELDTAIKAMPLELFLQVVGSTMKFEDMTQKCRSGTCLSDLSVEEYKHLMGNQATARLSNLVQILRGLKLIRMVRSENVGDGDAAAVLDTTLTYSLELKPYIEEPVSLAPSSSAFVSFDIRPQYRHDFVLSSRKAVDEYWNTLEYCYAAVDRKAALHAFPGSAVHEVFLARSWASARVMTADQRAELNKCIMKNGPDKKLSLSACEKIAKDLSLTLEQVLRVYYDNRQKRHTRLKEVLKQEEIQPLNRTRASSSRKRKRSSRKSPSEHANVDSVESVFMSSDTGDKFIDGHNDLGTPTAEQEFNMLNDQADENMNSIEEFEVQEKDDDDHSFISECALSRLKPIHRRKFSWTENADRQLVMEYVRERAALGANFHRIDWNALTNLPASPAVCKRRMAILNSSIQFRKAVLKLCNILTERYAKHLSELQNKSVLDGECREMMRNNASAGHNSRKDSDGLQQSQEINPEDHWDDFNNKDVKMAFDEALRHKRTAKLDVHREIHSVSDEFSHPREDGEQNDPKLLSSAISNKRKRKRAMRSNVSGRLQKKYVKFLNGGADVNRRAFRSLAISNAVELFKLVFLNASTAPEVPTLLAETLRRYSEHDLFAAFNYLRDAKIMVGGSGASPFVLSQKFIHGISSSPYPTNTGKIAAEFRRWLHGKEKNLMEEGIDIPANLQCGDVVYLSALLSSREILILPCLPDQGVGEAEDLRTPKRRHDNEIYCADKAKKPKAATIGEGEICSRREKGFPGIRLSLTRATISRIDIIDLFKERDVHSDEFLGGRNEQKSSSHAGSTKIDHMKEILDRDNAVPLKICADNTPWEAMTSYADNLKYIVNNQVRESPFCPQIFKTVYSAIQKAGDQGLSMEEISKVTNIQGDKMPEIIVEVLEAFGRALKVNAYDSVHVVDSLYRSKYCLTSLGDPRQYRKEDPSTDSSLIVDKQPLVLHPDNHENDSANVPSTSIIDDDEHRVTILNLPEDIQPSSEVQKDIETESCQQLSTFPEKHQVNDINKFHNGNSYLCRPILSWMNGDGTINEVVYKGLIRRVLGILMQNPGMLEADIIRRMHVLNPQSCRKLLELMILDNAIIVRKMHQATSCEPPSLLGGLIGSSFKKPNSVFREHFFADPVSAATLL
ncbi:B-block binding subunit of TFIIIC [Heracleum sosnowskyi]|uniref:B-block binding subunit of TFIIIC n=1 Tax=Heracleum sosnowskyi TaxID=360622 RepID=A0AAD8M1K1_9APIA|nr:B-block binding subunit of TFIIIC [Heracleum sosnowskyi]